jgi:WS/DGAT/MGAT family acyltransferase
VGAPLDQAAFERLSGDDVVALATDVGPVPMQVGAILWLGARSDPAALAGLIGERIRTVARLRERLRPTPPGAGRPVWIDDPGFALSDHLTVTDTPCTHDGVLTIAATAVTTPLDRDRPLWRMVYVSRVGHDRAALVVVFHHVLADGIGGLAVLAHLVDGDAVAADADFPRPPPTARGLLADAWRRRLHTLRHPGRSLHRLRAAAAQLRPTPGRVAAARCSLNRPTGPRRALAVVETDLEPLHRTARAHGATVNDVLLSAVTGALDELLAARREHVDRLVVSMPVSARASTDAATLGNEVGPVPVALPTAGPPLERLAAVAAVTTAAKRTAPGSSTAIIGPVFRALARLGLFRRFIERQHLVHTFVTNLRGPDAPLALGGAEIETVAAVAVVTGNVTLSFAALSYAGRLTVTVIADPDACPDLPRLRDALDRHLDELGTVGG